jgi:serine phosphatase RsbU (regulator of sigma subunit)
LRRAIWLFYTDGVTEAMNAQRELFGEERLIDLLQRHHPRTPQEVIAAVLEALNAFVGNQSQSDDITMIVVKRLSGKE